MKLVIRKPAAADLDDIFLKVAIERPMAAEQLVNRLINAIQGLRDFPLAGRPAAGARRELVTVKPYIVIYRVDAQRISVLRVLHGARRR